MAESSPAAAKKERLIFIDVMRGIAVLWMIETHVVDACTSSAHKAGLLYAWLDISNGFVAVSFIFCAGAGFWLAAMRKSGEYKRFGPALWIYLRRLGFILALGYWLHLPAMSLQKMFHLGRDELLRFLDCDVLQEIVFSSLIALILLLLIPRLKILPYLFIALTLSVYFLAPLEWARDPMSSLPPFFGAILSKPPISKFPLFPWSGYFFAGAALTAFFYNAKNKQRFCLVVAIVSFCLPYILFRIKDLPFAYPGDSDWWHCSPGHSFYRLSGAALVFSLLFLFENYYKGRIFGSVMQVCGQESLFIYVAHLMFVYGSVINLGMKYYINARLGVLSTIVLLAALCTASYFSARVWNSLKATEPRWAKTVLYSLCLLWLVIFAVNPW